MHIGFVGLQNGYCLSFKVGGSEVGLTHACNDLLQLKRCWAQSVSLYICLTTFQPEGAMVGF